MCPAGMNCYPFVRKGNFLKRMDFPASPADYRCLLGARYRPTIGLIWTPPVLAGDFVVMASRCGCSLISYVCRAWLCVALMKSAEEGLISRKDSRSKVRFRFASPRSDLFHHHENVTCFNPVGCPSR